jgi:type IV secretory pathway TrbL component
VNDKQDAISDLETIRTGAAAGAVAEKNAKDYADGLAGNYDASGSAATAEQNAKNYATGLVMDGEKVRFDAAGSAAGAQAAAEATAKAYADAEIVKVNANIEENERVTAESLTDLNTRVKDLKDTTYNKTEIDTMVENVIVVASDEEIDNLFN